MAKAARLFVFRPGLFCQDLLKAAEDSRIWVLTEM
jgi:hypothetical protein